MFAAELCHVLRPGFPFLIAPALLTAAPETERTIDVVERHGMVEMTSARWESDWPKRARASMDVKYFRASLTRAVWPL